MEKSGKDIMESPENGDIIFWMNPAGPVIAEKWVVWKKSSPDLHYRNSMNPLPGGKNHLKKSSAIKSRIHMPVIPWTGSIFSLEKLFLPLQICWIQTSS